MAIESYLERIKKARQSAQERIEAELPKAKVLLERSLETTSALTAKTASAVSESCNNAVDKAKQSLESGDLQRAGERLKYPSGQLTFRTPALRTMVSAYF